MEGAIKGSIDGQVCTLPPLPPNTARRHLKTPHPSPTHHRAPQSTKHQLSMEGGKDQPTKGNMTDITLQKYILGQEEKIVGGSILEVQPQ